MDHQSWGGSKVRPSWYIYQKAFIFSSEDFHVQTYDFHSSHLLEKPAMRNLAVFLAELINM